MDLSEFSPKERKRFFKWLEAARTEMFPKMKDSVAAIVPMLGDKPDPQVCLQVGAAIMFDKPILVAVLRGQKVPLALRTIAHKIVEISMPPTQADREATSKAIGEMLEASRFRGAAKES